MSDDIIKNAGKCGLCGDEIESTYRHDYKACSCGNLFVDGGHDYQRYGYDSTRETGESALWSSKHQRWVTFSEITKETAEKQAEIDEQKERVKTRRRKLMLP